MSWIAEMLLQDFWEGIVAAAYRRWGRVGGGLGFVIPPAIVLLMVWALVR